MNRIDRLMGIITHLQAKKHCTSQQLATHFGISERTVFRDLRAIGEIGIPLVFETGKGYSIVPGFFLPPVSLTIEEANALALTEPLVLRFADKSIQKHVSTALSKIKMVLGRSQRDKMELLQAQNRPFHSGQLRAPAALHRLPDDATERHHPKNPAPHGL